MPKNKKRNLPQPARPPEFALIQNPSQISITHQQLSQQAFSGPLPPPETLKQYDELLPGTAERIIRMAETQMSHRHGIELGTLQANIELANRDRTTYRIGQCFGLCIGVVALLCATYSAANGAQIVGSIIGGGGLASLVGVFLAARWDKKRDDKPEEPSPPEPA